MDRVNEWLPAVAIPEKKDGYIPNVLNSQNGRFHPYLLTVGDPLVIYSPVSEGQNLSLVVQGLDLSKQYYNGYDHYTYRGTHDNDILNVVSTDSPEGTVGAHYVAAKAGYAQNLCADGSKVVRTMYVEVREPQGRMLDHADIEIADGGKYTSSKVVRQADGTLVKTVKVYDSYVLDVNESILYQSQDDSTTCQFYHDDNGQQPYAPEENRRGYRTEDYWVDSSIAPGSPQYELTSKYNLEIQPNYWSDKKFYVGEVDHVVFDVKLGLDPLEERTYTKVDGVWVLTGTKSCSGEDIVIKYNATLNENADRTKKGNENTVDLTFSNNPSHTYDGENEPSETEKNSGDNVVGKTPESNTKTYTTGIKVVKIDAKTGERLKGAEFQAQGDGLNKVVSPRLLPSRWTQMVPTTS